MTCIERIAGKYFGQLITAAVHFTREGQQVWNTLADCDVFVLPGSIMDVPNHFRISLTASEPMIERSLSAFAEVAQAVCDERQPAA